MRLFQQNKRHAYKRWVVKTTNLPYNNQIAFTDTLPPSARPAPRPPISTPDDKSASAPNPDDTPPNGGVWAWLSRRPAPGRSQLANPSTAPAENHYTHMDEEEQPYAIYAELDRQCNSPAYQNSAYTDAEGSAPSSAYYSDLSAGAAPDRAYEVVGLSTLPLWDGAEGKRQPRLAAISEGMGVPSDYVWGGISVLTCSSAI